MNKPACRRGAVLLVTCQLWAGRWRQDRARLVAGRLAYQSICGRALYLCIARSAQTSSSAA